MFYFGFLDLLAPILILILSLLYLPITFVLLLKNREFSYLKSWNMFRQDWFARFWSFFGQASKPLFAADVEPILPGARGIVLDVGTGSGDWLYMFSAARNRNITKLFLCEPNARFHEKLRAAAQSHGLEGRYEIIGGGVEELSKHGVHKGTIDTVTTVHVLCSVSSPAPLINELYEYLRPGGQWLVYEHVKASEGQSVATAYQGAVDFVWPSFLDGCSLTRDTEGLLLRAGKWHAVDLRPGSNQGRFDPLPHIRGTLTKAEQ